MAESRRRADQWASFRLHLIGRAATCIAILSVVGVVGLTVDAVADTWPIALLMAFALLLTGPYYYLGTAHPDRLRAISLGVILAEVALLAIGEYLLGGENAVYGLPLYGILIVMAATLHSDRAAYAVAFLGAASYAAVAFSPGGGWLPAHPGPAVLSRPDAWAVTSTLVNLFFGLATAVVAGSLSRVKEVALARSEAAERELRDLNRELGRRVEEAVQALRATNRSLEDRNSHLASTLHQVNLFATAVSHDLRNPVTAASEALRLSGEFEAPRRDAYVSLARENLARADRMVVGLRNLMRAVGTRAAPGRISAGSLLEEVMEDLCTQKLGRPLPVVLREPLGEIEGDREQLKHLFHNLISNALDHNPGAEDLSIEVGEDGSSEEACFYVSDNGQGIAADIQPRIFAPFHRGPEASSEGLGLGLSLAQAIVAGVGGRIWVESVPGQGATFRFTVPRYGGGP